MQLPLYQDNEVKPIRLDQLDVSDLNVRRQDITADIDALMESLETFGLLQPIVVVPKGDRYSVIIGQRRYLAAKELGWDTIPAFLARSLDRVEGTILSLSENVQRRDLSARDRAEACALLLNARGGIANVASLLGVSPSTVKRWLGYRAVPEPIKTLVDERKLTSNQATRIWQHIDNEETALAVAVHAAEEATPIGRRRVVESAEEYPGRSAETIIRRAEERKREKVLTIHLPESAALAIEEASEREKIEPEGIALNATIQWLQDNRYLP